MTKLKITAIIPFLLIGLLFTSCKDEENNTSESINKIMPLGASRVQGFTPVFESYRYQLWKQLAENEWDVDFVGPRKEVTEYETVNGKTFDGDHAGWAGWKSSDINKELTKNLANMETPDIVLFSSPGGNDALNGVAYDSIIPNVISIIDLLQKKNPNVTIIIEEMAPGNEEIMQSPLAPIFDKAHKDMQALASSKSTTTSKVMTVDMHTGFDNTSMLADNIHYNAKGATFIATQYYNVLKDILKK